MTGGAPSGWLVGRAVPDADRSLYCFPHSGGLPGEYVRWGRVLPGVQVHGVTPPGRGTEGDAVAPTDLPGFVSMLLDAVDFAPPFVLFGHSLGALVAFETARALRDRERALPERLVLSGLGPPGAGYRTRGWHALPDDDLARALREDPALLPPAVAADPALLELLLPAFRTDLTLLETYAYAPGDPLPLPLDVLCGERDELSSAVLERWGEHTSAGMHLKRLPGGHFPFRDEPAAFHEALRRSLVLSERSTARATPCSPNTGAVGGVRERRS